MDYRYSLYDALVSINVPNDKARAVVDAMEREMGTTLATKTDLDHLRGEVRQEIALVRKDLEILSGSVRGEIAGVRKDLELLSTTMTVRLGSMLVVGFGLTIAALKFFQA
ncbi:MAG: hypothetical protein E4H19_03840 [Chromatiales bacterium]|nr:MAG: hypothetical protein E4H19_03840 [Chromatiales bacterium]